MKLEQACVSVRVDHWKRFTVVSAAKGLTASASIRLLVAEFLRKEAREAREAVGA